MAENKLAIRQGSEDTVRFELTNNGSPFNLTGIQNLQLLLRNLTTEEVVSYSINDAAPQLFVISEISGYVDFVLKQDTFVSPNMHTGHFLVTDSASKTYIVPDDSDGDIYIEVYKKYE